MQLFVNLIIMDEYVKSYRQLPWICRRLKPWAYTDNNNKPTNRAILVLTEGFVTLQ